MPAALCAQLLQVLPYLTLVDKWLLGMFWLLVAVGVECVVVNQLLPRAGAAAVATDGGRRGVQGMLGVHVRVNTGVAGVQAVGIASDPRVHVARHRGGARAV